VTGKVLVGKQLRILYLSKESRLAVI